MRRRRSSRRRRATGPTTTSSTPTDAIPISVDAFQAPWGACIGGRMWTLSGEEFGRALAALRGSLKRATLDRMMREAFRGRGRVARSGERHG